MPKTPIGVFARDGQTRQAYTAGEATSLRNAGWSPAVAEADAAPGPEPVVMEPVPDAPAETDQLEQSPNKKKDQA